MHPESDAKFKYCPLLKTRDDKLKFCLASACMFWRWEHPSKTGSDDKGYCGAAGPAVAIALLRGADDDQKPIEDY